MAPPYNPDLWEEALIDFVSEPIRQGINLKTAKSVYSYAATFGATRTKMAHLGGYLPKHFYDQDQGIIWKYKKHVLFVHRDGVVLGKDGVRTFVTLTPTGWITVIEQIGSSLKVHNGDHLNEAVIEHYVAWVEKQTALQTAKPDAEQPDSSSL